MSIRRVLLATCAILAFSLTSVGDPPKPPAPEPADGLPTGKWRVEFANGVVETCEINKDGTASVVEPRRTAGVSRFPIAGGHAGARDR